MTSLGDVLHAMDAAADAEEAGALGDAYGLYMSAIEALDDALGASDCTKRRMMLVMLSNAHNSLGSMLATPDADAAAIARARDHL